MTDYITQVQKSIKDSDIEKTKQLLGKLKDAPLETKLEVLQVLALAPDITAIDLLPLLIQAVSSDEEVHDRVVQLLIDRAHLNFRFSLILYTTCSKNMILQIVPLMKHILSKETDFEILKETIKTAGRQRIEALVDDVAEFIFYDEATLKAEAVTALERIGTDSAYKNLIKAADSSKCDQDILDSIEVLKNRVEEPEKKEKKNSEKQNLSDDILFFNNNLKSGDIHTRFAGLTKLAESGSDITEVLVDNLKSKEHDLIINSLSLINRTLPKNLISEVFNLLENKSIDKKIKFAAYIALEAFPELESAAFAISGINDSSMHVRTAAVKVLDKNLTDFVFAEIKDKIESGTEAGKKLGESILDAHADNLIVQLMVSDAFTYIVSNYIEKKGSFQVLENYIKIQKNRKLMASAKKYEKILKKKQKKERLKFLILSNSQTCSNIYTKILFSGGYSSNSFYNSQTAFESLMTEKPFAVICDLFLNDMMGIDFINEIREVHSEKELPIIISTLQNDFLDPEQNIIAFPPGINQIHSCFEHL